MFSDYCSNLKSKISALSEHKRHQDRNIYDVFKKVMRFKKGVATVFTLLFTFTAMVSYAAPQYFDVEIIDGKSTFGLATAGTTVEELLANSGVEVSEYDMVTPGLDSYVNSSQTVVVQRVKKVSVTVSGETVQYLTTADTVGDFLKEKSIDVNYHDIINLPLETKLKTDNELEIVRVVRRIVKEETEVPFETKTVRDTSLSISDSKILTQGVTGIDCQTYEVVLHDGVEITRELVSKERTREPVAEVKAVGAASGGVRLLEKGDDFSYSKVITCNATAYDLSFQSCGKWPGDPGYGITASGTHAKYGTVAVDPRVIPLGTRMYIESTDGSFVYGYCVAEDTGGAIKGNTVDLFFSSYNECMQFGRRSVKVYILD